jgi:hypothetical protein
LVALAADAAEESGLLQNDGPGNNGEHQKKQQNAAGDPASLLENFEKIGCKNRREQKNDVPLSENQWYVTAERSTFFRA